VVKSDVERVDVGGLEFACRHLVLEEKVHLGKRTSSRLGESEVVVDEHAEASAGPEETSKISPVPCGRVLSTVSVAPRGERAVLTIM
jgi:hypothetical protein